MITKISEIETGQVQSNQFSCPNINCHHYATPGGKNIYLCARYGRKKVRLLKCNACGKTFSELKGSPFWSSRLDWDRIEKIYRTLLDGNAIRATARLNKISKNTVKRYLRLAQRDFLMIEKFLTERGILSPDTSCRLRNLVDQDLDRSATCREFVNCMQ